MPTNCRRTSLARRLEQHIAARYGDGLTGAQTRSMLRPLLAWWRERGVGFASELSAPLAREGFLAACENLGLATRIRLRSCLLLFLRFLVQRQDLTQDLGAAIPATRKPHRVPFVFTRPQIRLLIEKGYERIEPPWRRRTYQTITFVLYATGLRISEALRLRVRDVDFAAHTIFVRRGKFGKDRLLPVSQQTRRRLGAYLRLTRQPARRRGPEAFVFSHGGRGYTKNTIGEQFRRALRAVGLWRPPRQVGEVIYAHPHVHSLRHTFAVHRLLKWYAEGADVQAKLPLLTIYMGHVAPEHTAVYLAASEMTLAQAAGRFEALLKQWVNGGA